MPNSTTHQNSSRSKTNTNYIKKHKKNHKIKQKNCKKSEITRSAILTRPSRRESFLILIRWNWILPFQGKLSGSSKCRILSLYTSTASTLWGVSDMIFSQRWDPMNPPAPIMHIVIAGIGFPFRSSLTADDAIAQVESVQWEEGRRMRRYLYV